MTPILCLVFAATFPGVQWESHDRAGWNVALLQGARQFTATKKTAAVVIVQGGRVVDQWGAVTRKIEVRSIRKSFLSALYGIHVAEGRISLGATLGELGIDDRPPGLTPIEKQATVLDLLRARSGVYHEPARETASMRARRPLRGSKQPGDYYYYNNWDFNVLGTIFEKVTGKMIFEEFAARIAQPTGMQDYVVADGRFAAQEGSTLAGDSVHLNYIFSMSARDMARFGYLYLRDGRWGDKQVLPKGWVERSTTNYSRTSDLGAQTGYGFLWWTEEWGYSALGAGGHVIAVVPKKDLVIVHRVAYDPPKVEDVVSYRDVDALVRMVMAAAPGN